MTLEGFNFLLGLELKSVFSNKIRIRKNTTKLVFSPLLLLHLSHQVRGGTRIAEVIMGLKKMISEKACNRPLIFLV